VNRDHSSRATSWARRLRRSHHRRPTPARLAKIELVSFDVDGVLATRTKWFSNQGWVAAGYDSADGLGVELLLANGIAVVALTTSRHGIIESRARSITGLEVISNRTDKGTALTERLNRDGINPAHSLHVGDDLWDCLAYEVAGIAVAVADAHPSARDAADWTTRAPGGGGAVREVADALLDARGITDADLLSRHRHP
jgi:3-deoxy-D-manno-octulosonate 8-phosphate phosphatase (KDO 8-P phosphatase)